MKKEHTHERDGEPEVKGSEVMAIHAKEKQRLATTSPTCAGRQGIPDNIPRNDHEQHENENNAIDDEIESGLASVLILPGILFLILHRLSAVFDDHPSDMQYKCQYSSD